MNNRTLLWIRLVVLILSFVAVLAAAVVAMTGGKFSVSLIGDGKLAAEASFSDVTDIAVEGRTCAVEIVAGTGPDVVARYYTGGLLPAETPVWEQTGGTPRYHRQRQFPVRRPSGPGSARRFRAELSAGHYLRWHPGFCGWQHFDCPVYHRQRQSV